MHLVRLFYPRLSALSAVKIRLSLQFRSSGFRVGDMTHQMFMQLWPSLSAASAMDVTPDNASYIGYRRRIRFFLKNGPFRAPVRLAVASAFT